VLPVRWRVQGQGGGAAPVDGAAAVVTVVGVRARGGAGPLLDMCQERRGRCGLGLHGATEGRKAKGISLERHAREGQEAAACAPT
jgi:hypothetical protein